MTPWTTDVTRDPASGNVRLSLLLTLDPGPARHFRHFLDVELDRNHALELLANLSVVLGDRRPDVAK